MNYMHEESFNDFDRQSFEFILKYFGKNTRILDVGAGTGKYQAHLGHYYKSFDAIEIYKPYLRAFDLENKYNKVYLFDVKNFDFDKNKYDLVILGNVLELFSVKEAKSLLKKIIDSDTSILLSIHFLYNDILANENSWNECKQDDLTKEIMAKRYKELICFKRNFRHAIYYYFTENVKLKIQTIIFTCLPKVDDIFFHRDHHKKIFSNVACVRNLFELENVEKHNEIIDIIAPAPMSVPDKIMTNCINFFKEEDPFYYIFLEWDAIVIDPDFEKKCIDFMEKNNIDAMFNGLRNKFTDGENGLFVKQYPRTMAKTWTTVSCIVLNRIAAKFYLRSFTKRLYPDYWCEIAFPTILAQEGFFIAQNPFIDRNYCTHIKAASMDDFDIREAIEKRTSVIHPLKKRERLNFVLKELDKKGIKF